VAEGMEVDTVNAEAEDTPSEAQDMSVAVEEAKNVAVMVVEVGQFILFLCPLCFFVD